MCFLSMLFVTSQFFDHVPRKLDVNCGKKERLIYKNCTGDKASLISRKHFALNPPKLEQNMNLKAYLPTRFNSFYIFQKSR